MRVPVYDTPQVQATALPAVRQSLNYDNGLNAVGQGVQQLGQGVQRAMDAQAEAVRKAKAEADAAAIAKATTEWQNRAVDVEHGTADGKTPGFYALQGDAAVAQSAPTIEQLQKAQKDIAKGLADDDQRKTFLDHTSGLMVGHRSAIEQYAGRQTQVAKEERARALAESSVRVAGANYTDDKMAADAFGSARLAILAQMDGAPEEAKQAALAELGQRMTAARLDCAIQGEDLATAERLLQTNGAQLGALAPKYTKTVATLKAKVMGQKNAAAAVAVATDPDTGLVDQTKLAQAYAATPDEAKTPEFQQAFQAASSRALALDKGQREQVFQEAYTQYLRGGLAGVDAQHQSWLIQNDPPGWDALKQKAARDAAAKARASAGDHGPTPSEVSSFVDLQIDMADHPDTYAAMTPAELARTWAPRLSQQDWAKAGTKLAEIHAAANRPDKDLRLPVMVTQSVTELFRKTFGLEGLKQAAVSKWPLEKQRLFYAVLDKVEQRERDWKRDNRGNAPTLDQYNKWAGMELTPHAVEGSGISLLGHTFFGKTSTPVEDRVKGLGMPSDRPVQSAAGLNLDAPDPSTTKAVRGYRYNQSRTMRIPVYEDGTQGAPEAAK